MQHRILSNPKIKIFWDTAVDEILGEAGLEKIRIKNLKTNKTSDLNVTGLFIAIGHKPNTELFQEYVDINPAGYIVTTEGTKTKVPGFFAAGDVQDHVYRQAVTAAGTGCMAAIDAERFLELERENG